MADAGPTRKHWIERSTYVVLCCALMLAQLIPLETVPPSLGGTNLDLALGPDQTAINVQTNPDQQVGTIAEEGTNPIRWIAPDFLLLLTLAWVVRRPSVVPAIAVAVLFLTADFLFQRPPGLWAALVLIMSEVLRSRSYGLRTLPFWIEWVTVGLGVAAMTLIYRFTLSMLLVPQASLGLTLFHLSLTIAMYPLVVFVSFIVFGIKRPAPGEVDAYGHRI